MGGTIWSDTDYTARSATKKASHGTAFAYDADIKTGKAATAAHATLDPKGLGMRESRDSDAHPTSNAIAVWLDETGSMSAVIQEIYDSLPQLMGIITRKNYIVDPQIMFSAVGDANSDRVPLQVGQFESGAEMEGDLGNFYLEGNGGGQMPPQESYELAAYVTARHTSIDCLEKRGKLGYCFIIGDEMPYAKVRAAHVRKLIGGGLEADIPTVDIFEELKAKYNVFFILPTNATGGRGRGLTKDQLLGTWRQLLGPEHVLELEDASGAAQLIAAQIGMCEGTTDLDGAMTDLVEAGTSEALVKVVRSAVSKAYAGGTVAKVEAGALAEPRPDSGAKRI